MKYLWGMIIITNSAKKMIAKGLGCFLLFFLSSLNALLAQGIGNEARTLFNEKLAMKGALINIEVLNLDSTHLYYLTEANEHRKILLLETDFLVVDDKEKAERLKLQSKRYAPFLKTSDELFTGITEGNSSFRHAFFSAKAFKNKEIVLLNSELKYLVNHHEGKAQGALFASLISAGLGIATPHLGIESKNLHQGIGIGFASLTIGFATKFYIHQRKARVYKVAF